jgi:CarD family transcriptional regulator
MFSVGDKVMHCTHGAGVITEKKKMHITDTPHCYLVIQLLGSDSTLMVPKDQAEERLRPVCKGATLRRLLTSELAGEPEKLPQDYKERQKCIEGKLKSGETQVWIEVVRDLTWQSKQKPLSQGDQKLLDRAMDLLSGELALAHGIPLEEAEPRLDSMVQRRHELADGQGERLSWWQTLEQKVREPFVRSSEGSG